MDRRFAKSKGMYRSSLHLVFSFRRFSLTVAALFWLAALLSSSCKCDCGSHPQTDKKTESGLAEAESAPSVVLLIIDTLRADKLGCYGFDKETSPELDALAGRGVRFSSTVSQCSWTRPSIGSMVTGVYPRALGLYKQRKQRLPADAVCLSEMLKKRGYTTVGVTANPNINAVFGFDQGFDRYADSDHIWPWMKRDEDQQRARRGSLMPDLEVFDTAVELIREAGPPPYYVQLNIMEMHTYGAPVRPEYEDHFEGETNERYLNALRQVSADIGDFVERLGKLPGFESTLYVFASDHGEGLDDHPGIRGGRGHGVLLYESQLRMPLIMYHSGDDLPAGRVIERPVRNLEIVPTIADLLKVPTPDGVDGVSLAPLLDDPGAQLPIPRRFVVETYFRKADKIGVYAPKWKYFENRDDWAGLNPRELQQRGVKERGAETDRIEEHPEIAAPLDDYLQKWEASHPKAPPTATTAARSNDAVQQLKALGYID